VRITDSAIVAAATLSHRYISIGSPDKAIDLVAGGGASQDAGGFEARRARFLRS
jgi:ATP-dependent Clp protease ATP-binding subunit ClpA